MIIVPQSAELINPPKNPEQHIELMGRVSYRSEDKITQNSAAKFIRMIIRRGHESVLEHASASFRFVTDRGISHELVRHRLAAYTQESTRFCKYGEDIQVIQPPVFDQNSFGAWQCAMIEAEEKYHYLLEQGQKPEIARSVLPTCLKTVINMTANFREWRHVIKLRTHETAHPQIRKLIGMARDQLIELAPNVFEEEA